MLSKKDIPDICVKCSNIFKTCCRCKPGEEKVTTLLSKHEVKMIHTVIPKSNIGKYIIKETNSVEFIKKMITLFPSHVDSILANYKINGWHYRLKISKNFACCFLSDDGCILSNKTRPYFCQIYPFWFIDDKLQYFENDECLAVQECKSVDKIIKIFNINEEQLSDIFNKICNFWGITI